MYFSEMDSVSICVLRLVDVWDVHIHRKWGKRTDYIFLGSLLCILYLNEGLPVMASVKIPKFCIYILIILIDGTFLRDPWFVLAA